MITMMARPSGPPVSMFSLKRHELDAEVVQLVEHFEEVPDRAGDPVAGPDQHDVELPRSGIFQHLVQAGAARFGAAEPVGIFLHDLKATLSGQARADRKAGFPGADPVSRRACRARRAASVLLQGQHVILHLADGCIEEAEATETGLRLIHFEQGFHLEELDGGAGAPKLKVDL